MAALKAVSAGLVGCALGLVLAASAASADQQTFTFHNWFQIEFCEDVKHLEFESSAPEMLVAWGLAADPFAADGAIHFYRWDLLSGRTLDRVDIPTAADFPKVALGGSATSRDGRRVLIANSSHELFLFDVESKTVVKRFSGHRFATVFAAFSSEERHVLAVDESRQVWVWAADGDEASPLQVIEPTSWTGRAELDDATGKLRLYTESAVITYDIDTGARESLTDLAQSIGVDRSHRPHSLVESPAEDGFAVETNTESGGGVSFLPKDARAATWRHDLGVVTPPAGTGLPTMINYPTGMAFSPNGACFVVGNHAAYDVLDPRGGSLLFRQRVNAAGYYLRFSPDGRFLVDTGGCDVQVYNVPPACAGSRE
jgi:hypothetical protein